MAIYSDTIVGLDELIKDFMKLPDDAIRFLEQASIDGGNKVLIDAKSRVPVDTGNLQRNLKLSKPGARRKRKTLVISRVSFSRKAAHAVPLELGHKMVIWGRKTDKHVRARPFLRPAADANKQYVVRVTEHALNRAIDTMTK
jgi:HK97 gp10 family phage protein